MTITIKIPCKTADNGKIMSEILTRLPELKLYIDVEPDRRNDVARSSNARRGFQMLGNIKRKVLEAHAKYSCAYLTRAEIAKETGLGLEQVRSAVGDGIRRRELTAENASMGTRTQINGHGLARLEHERIRILGHKAAAGV